tara:strand:- start:17037 stop:17468 length:432 start_codon:yes stop_codon:yes gene_type:complete
MKHVKTWFVVANQNSVRFFENLGVGKGLKTVDHTPHKRADDQPHDAQLGRTQNSVGHARHKLEANTSNAPDPFVTQLLDDLTRQFENGRFDRLVICAAPHVLGEIRGSMKPSIKKAVYAELDKDLVNTRLDELASHFETVMAL